MENFMKNVCIVGYGAIGPIHAGALENVENASLYAVCDVNPARRKACLEKYSVEAYDDFDRMLQDPAIHSVHICTPHYLHFDMIRKALAAGKDVVAEKPVTMTKGELDSLLELDGAGRVCVVFQNRLNPCIEKLKELIQEGQLGDVRAVRAVLTWHRDRAYYAQDAWRGRWETEGGGVLINQAIHTLDYFSYLIGEIASVKANMCNFSLEDVIEVEDTCTAYVSFANGVKGSFYATNGYGDNSAPFFEVAFEKGIVRYIDNQLWHNGRMLAEDEPPVMGKNYWGSGHARLLKRYYDEQKFFGVADAANTMSAVFAMYESAKKGGRDIEIK